MSVNVNIELSEEKKWSACAEDVSSRSRGWSAMRHITLLLMGLAFTVGLVFGLIIHLPGVSSPEGDLRNAQRSPRHLRSLAFAGEDEDKAVDVREAYSEITRLNTTQDTVYLPEVGSLGAAGLQSGRGALPQHNINDIQAQIKHTKDDIHALRRDSVHSSPVQGNNESPDTDSNANINLNIRGGHLAVSNTATVRVFKRPDSQTGIHRMAQDSVPGKHSMDESIDPYSVKRLPAEYSNLNNVLDGIYWSRELEMVLPAGYDADHVASWQQELDQNKVVRLSEGCGRMQNRLVTLEDGTRACARYRLNTDQIQGEVFSYYLARTLDIPNLPPTALAVPDTSCMAWAPVRDEVVAAQWHTRKALVLTPWQDDLQPAYIPRELRHKDGKLYPSAELLQGRDLNDLVELMQWSDLIVLDYLTANVDRVVNNLFNQQWNSAMMESPAHNLQRHASSHLLVFLDNESGLFHSYRLLDKYAQYHTRLLEALCIFRKSTADAIKRLHKEKSVGKSLHELFMKEERLYDYLPLMPEKNISVLQSRVKDVYNQIIDCESKYGSV